MTYIVVSGLPGSGKSTLARQLAPLLSLPVLDKDDVLDGLFDALGVGDAAWRSRLSRAADEVFARVAPTLSAALLVSWWRHRDAAGESGTPTTWLSALPSPVIELHCVCSPGVAARRFTARRRHPGHLDASRTFDAVAEEFARLSRFGPLGCGPLISVDTGAEVALDELVAALRAASDAS